MTSSLGDSSLGGSDCRKNKQCYSIIIILLVLSHQVKLASTASSDWLEAPYGDDSFNTRAEYGSNTTLSCSEDITAKNYTYLITPRVEYWILPDMTIMRVGDSMEFRTLDGFASWEVNEEGDMKIVLVTEKHFGFYHCVWKSNSSSSSSFSSSFSSSPGFVVAKKALNYKGPFFGDLWAFYRKNVIIGCCAGGGFCAIFTFILIIYEMKCANEDDDEKDGDLGYSSYANTNSPESYAHIGVSPGGGRVYVNGGVLQYGDGLVYRGEGMKDDSSAETRF